VSALTYRIQAFLDSASRAEPIKKAYLGEGQAKYLLSQLGVKAETLAHIVLISSLSEICSPDKSVSCTGTGRGSGSADYDVFSAGLRKWTNTDIESSLNHEGADEVGRALMTHLSDVVGSAVLFEGNFRLTGKKSKNEKILPFQWSQADKIQVGSELLHMMQTECMVKVSAGEAQAQLGLMSEGEADFIDPESDLYSVRAPSTRRQVLSAEQDGSPQVLLNAFAHTVEHRGFRSTGYISLRKELVEKLSGVMPRNGFYRLAPMVVPPLPWKDFWLCGFLTRRSPLVRFTGTRDGARDSRMLDLSLVRESLDYLGSAKWRVHSLIVDVIEDAVSSGRDDIPGIPRDSELEASRLSLRALKSSSSPSQHRRTDLMRMLKEKQSLQNEKPILRSKLETAKQFKDAMALYFPHSIDFRGRVYPIPAPFNHQSDDIVRAMLRFGDTKPLGTRGWFWLKVHCANLLGMDKTSLSARVDWVDSNLNHIKSVASNPLSPDSIAFVSSRTEDFWQSIAACIEIKKAVDSGNPESFPSSLPVHQDGSCNGLQHYAALGRDKLGALAVNLIPSEKVEDVYSFVLGIVRDQASKDAARAESLSLEDLIRECPANFQGLKSGDAKIKAILAQIAIKAPGVLQRRTVKQTVMTICYGVTQIGASDQMTKQLSELPIGKQLNSGQIAVLASYLARLTLASVDTVFKQAMEIKRWLDTVSSLANQHKLPVSWISPAGVPCRQPYRKSQVTEIQTPLQKITLMDEAMYDVAPVSKVKQRLGFPPNFIHSLDASHMILTSIQCKKAGITFASVHDSFWTHACDVDTMGNLIRQEFHRMYQEPILNRLRDSVVLSLGAHGKSVPPLPEPGDLDLACVLDSPYFFD
jgi:DNA-directed RNA polymerase